MIPSSALERDDAALWPSGLVALLFHLALLVLYWPRLVAPPDAPGPAHVFRVRLTQFSSVEAFRRFARTASFSDRDDGGAPTIGNVVLPAEAAGRAAPDLRAPGEVLRGEPIAPLPDRIFHGGAVLSPRSALVEAPEAPKPTFASARLPAAPDIPQIGAPAGLDAPAAPGGRFAAGGRPGLAGDPAAARGPADEIEAGPPTPRPTPSSRTPPVTRPSALEGVAPPTALPPQGVEALRPTWVAANAGPRQDIEDFRQAEIDAGRAPPVEIRPRRLVRQVEPPYPPWAREERLEPDIEFYVLVAPEGHVVRALYKRRSGYAELDRLALAAVRDWLYEAIPAGLEWRIATIRYRLR